MHTMIDTPKAPAVTGRYSQAIRVNNTIYLAGQIPLDPNTMEMIRGDIQEQIKQVFENLKAVAEAAGSALSNVVKLNVYLTDFSLISIVNEVITEYFKPPYPARTSVQVAALPKGSPIEIDAIIVM
ncbi:MAG: hypothetical protein ACD_60C00087G0026 [uncultured bacterium]|nr:MAG: hypothetical protein ACD_60C00087G0026 [uncultured bacterium]